ncbi:hypothetical protein DFQ28_004964, partial [Apophysomyces sp. BC1034]
QHLQGIYGVDVAESINIDFEPIEEQKMARPQDEDMIMNVILEETLEELQEEEKESEADEGPEYEVTLSAKEKLHRVNEVIFFLDENMHGKLKDQLR